MFADPFWVWIAAGAVLLAIEVATASGWLLWAAGCAAAVGLLTLLPIEMSEPVRIALFAILTMVSTLASRRLLPRRAEAGDDINDRTAALIGKTGRAQGAFRDGSGRVLIDGAEWDAESEDKVIADGARVRVEKVLGGARLSVRAAET